MTALMIFAAGLGTRLRPLTLTRPKAMIEVAGRPLIDHALATARAAGVERIVVNTHYLAEHLHAHLAGSGVTVAHEPELLETGGGLKAALPLLGEGPVFTLNADVLFTGANPLAELRAEWRPGDTALLLLTRGPSPDFALGADGSLTRRGPFTYAGAQMLRTEQLAMMPEGPFSLNLLWDALIAERAARGLEHEGGWLDVGRPEALPAADALLAEA